MPFRSPYALPTYAFLLLLAVGGYYAYAQTSQSQRYVIETVHVFPERITAEGWKNVDQITIQNLSDVSLYQEFNSFNSAYIDVDNHREKVHAIEEENDSTQTQENSKGVSSEEVDVSSSASSSQASSTSSEDVQLDAQDEEVPEEDTPAAVDESGLESGSSEQNTSSTTPPVSKVQKVKGLFTYALASVKELFPFAQESATTSSTTVASQDSSTSTAAPEEVVASSTEVTTNPTTTPSIDVESETNNNQDTHSTSSTDVSTPDNASTTDSGMVSTSTPTEASSTNAAPEEHNEAVSSVAPCTDTCIPYVITMSDFGLPIFDQTLRLGGGQLRVSFAAKRKPSHSEQQTVSVRYSFDDGAHWQDSGAILIDDEASNSINGGYYLFSIPELTQPEDLDTLSIEIRYQDDPRALEGIYLESAWLELFTVKAPDIREFDASQLLEDNGYDPDILSGDHLVLEDGEHIDFQYTDENNGEGLIIKSDRNEYGGLSKTTTYFSVTNTSNKKDSFSLQTYFPKGVGEVSAVEVWNQNKEKQVVIPEYRPFSYYCEAGWEATEQPVAQSLEAISQTLAEDFISQEQSTQTVSSSTTVSDTIASSTDSGNASTTTNEEGIATTTDTTNAQTDIASSTEVSTTAEGTTTDAVPEEQEQATLPSSTTTFDASSTALRSSTQTYLYAQAQTIASTTATSTTPHTDTPVEEDETHNFVCRQTNIVRSCDSIEGDNTLCQVDNVKVKDHVLTRYEGGWEKAETADGDIPKKKGLIAAAKSLFGLGPHPKHVPQEFEVAAHITDTYEIAPGETKYFKMDIAFPMFSEGEFWIEALGQREYGLLDPFWSSKWQYRIPILIDNTNGTTPMTQQQVYLQLDSALSDFWNNVNPDGSDIRFVQEKRVGNLYAATSSQFQNALGSAWTGRTAITIASTSVNASVSDFPVFVDLSTLGADFWSKVTSDGRDIRVTLNDGSTEVPIDLVEIDTNPQTGELHFLAPQLSGSSDTVFHIYYGNTSATAYASTSPLGSQAVWKNYEAVYHFSDDPTAISNIITDVSGNGQDLEVVNAALATTTGAMGTALDMTGTTVGILRDVGNDWAWTAGDDHVSTGLYYQTVSSAESIWQWGTTANPNWLSYMPWYTGASSSGRGYLYAGRNASTIWSRDPSVWHHFTTIAPATAGDFQGIYDNGIAEHSQTQSVTNMSNLGGLQIGRWTTAGSYNGYIDELRFAKNDDTFTSGWIKTEHLNQTDPTTFYATSTTVLTGGDTTPNWFSTSWERRQKITIPSVSADVSDYPVYVDLATLGADFFADVASDGRDIRVVQEDNKTEVPFELVSIDTSAQTGELYFKATLSSTTPSDFYLYFKNPDASAYARTDTYGSDNVWTNNYLAVYHLEEEASGSGNINVYKDSTANQYDGDDYTVSTGQEGKLGNGQQFGTDQLDRLSLPKNVLDGVDDLSTSWWHKTSITGAQSIVSAASGSGGSSNEYLLYFSSPTAFYIYNESIANGFGLTAMNDNVWHAFTSTRDVAAGQTYFYRDGSADTENPDPLASDTINVANGGLIIGQDQDSVGGGYASNQNFEGQLDELRFADVVRSDGWIEVAYTNQNNPSSFYATSTVESLQATEFKELDFWLQHFSSTTQESDIWVQVDEIPAGEQATIWMYYGNSNAVSASDEFAPFTYDSLTDTYYVVHGNTSVDITLYSLVDNNQVQVDGGAITPLNAGESMTISGYASTSVIRTLGPITSRQITGEGEPVVPISFASDTHLALGNRNNPEQFHVYAPFGDASVSIYNGAAATASATATVVSGSDKILSFDIPSYTTAAVVESTQPILLYNEGASSNDSVISYPPTTEDLFGFHSNYWFISTAQTSTNYDVHCESGASAIGQTVTRGDQGGNNICPSGNDVPNNTAVRITNQTDPVSAIQQADSDGYESTVFLPEREFGTEYYIPTSADYVAVICTPHFGTTTLEIYTPGAGTPTETATCIPTATNPDSIRFTNGGTGDSLAYAAGSRIISSNNVPFYVIYDHDSSADETNVWSSVQGRKYHASDFAYSFGQQEIANDAQYEQLSYLWYQNTDALTPTSTWEISAGEYLSEGQPITGTGAVDTGDVMRLRMNLQTSNATATANASAFKLQYAQAAVGQCSAASVWTDLGAIGSSTAVFRGYDNPSVADGITLATTTLASSTALATYEERNLSNFLPQDLPIASVAEWDWVIEVNNVAVNTNYCFRMVKAAGTPLETYTTYPEVITVGPPETPTPFLHFDNEKTSVTKSVLEFAATDIAGDEINYEIEIANDVNFNSVVVARNSVANFLEFENLITSADKAPFNSGARIRFTSPTALATGTTYWWHVRASDPNGSATSSAWSVPMSFTVDDTVTVSQWHQTTGDQFATDGLTSVATSSGGVSVVGSNGTVISTPIDFDDASVGNAWGEVSWNDTETSGEITYQVQYKQNGSWQLVPNDLIPGNTAGTSTSPINILELDTDIYNEIRLVANFNGSTLSLQDWTVSWGLRVETPVLGDRFDNEKTAATLPVFDFISSDPQGNDLEYEISWSSDYAFTTASTTHNSSADPGFANTADGADTSPFHSGDRITYTTQASEAFTDGNTYWWRVRAKDPAGGNSWSPWSEPDAFTVDTAITKSTWFQTTEDQFNQGILEGVVATSSGSVVVTEDIGEYGSVTLTDNTWTTISTQNTYRSMVVVASPEYLATNSNGRSPRIRNKTKNSFEIKVDNETENLTGTTNVSYLVMEAGTWQIADGAGGAQVVAGTEKAVSRDYIRSYHTGYLAGPQIDFNPTFSSAPTVFATIASDNDSSWVMTHADGCGPSGAQVEATPQKMCVAMGESTLTVADHQPEDIDYIAIEATDGSNNGGAFKTFNSPDVVTGNATVVSYPSAFGSAPATVLAFNNAEDGGDGGMGSVTTAGTHSNSQTTLQITEFGPAEGGHTDEIVSVAAFENASGIIKRDNTSGSLTGTIYGEDIIFTDGTGPKFKDFSFTDSTPGGSDITYQLQYKVSEGVYALIPDSDIPGNSSGTSTSPIDLTGVDVDTYGIIRPVATFSCNAGVCPELQEWQLQWSEGVNMSGTLKQYDRSTAVASGTIKAAVNGVPVAGSGTVSAGVWTLNNITAFAGDVITVWVDGANEANEAVTVFVYDGLGDMTDVALYEQHLAIDAGEKGTLTNALLSSYDNSVSGDEDIFFDVDASNSLTVCATGSCTDANLYIADGQTYIAATSSATTIKTHDFINNGTIELDANTFEVSGSWINNATSSTDTSTLIMTASTSDESITSTESPLNFHNITFGAGSGTSTYSISAPLDLSGNLKIVSGTFDRANYDITVEGNIETTNGLWSGIATTTFDGSGSVIWSDAHSSSSLQNIGNVVIDGASKIVTIGSDVAAYDVTIGSNDTLSGGGAYTIYVHGDWTNTGTFLSETSTVYIANDDRSYPPIIPGSQDWYADHAFVDRLPIVIDHTEVPASLNDFPVYVDMSTLGDDFWNSVQSDGADIRITTGDGQTEVPYDLVTIDTSAHTGELYFLAPSVSQATDTTFYLYHNNPAASAYPASATYGSQSVWKHYEAVYHFEDDPTADGNTITDVSGHGHTLTVSGAALATSTGALGTAIDLRGSVGILKDTSWTWTAGDRHVVSGWYKMAAASSEALWQWGTGSTFMYTPWYSGSSRGYHRFGSSAGGTYYDFSPRDTVNWQHFTTIAPTSTGQLLYVYENAIERDAATQQVDNPSASGLYLGRYGTTGSIEAEFDEIRIATSSRSSDWIQAEYTNQHTPNTFYATSSIQTYVPDTVIDQATHIITAGGSNFYHLHFDDATTSPSFADPSVVASGDFTIETGTISMPTGKMTIGGSFTNNGVFMHNNAEVEFNGNGTHTIALGGTAYLNALYDVTFSGSGAWAFTDTNATTSHIMTINNGSVTFPSGTLTIGATLHTNGGSFAHNGGSVIFLPNTPQNVTTNGSSFNNVSFGDGTPLSWYGIAWQKRVPITIADNTVTETLTDFPVYVNLAHFDDTFWSTVASNGADIRITTANGVTELPVDVVEIDTIAKTGELHFLADTIQKTASTTFYLYFDNPSATLYNPSDTYGSQAVWKNYEAVYHFNDGTVNVTDETSHGRDLTTVVGTASSTTGLLGAAIDTTASSVRLESSSWTWQAGDDLISSGLYFMDAVDSGALWQFGVGSGSNNGTYMSFLPWYSGTQTGYHQFGYTSAAAYNFVRDNTVWHHFTTIGHAAAGSVSEIYDQNVLRDSWTQITSSANPSNGPLKIGCYQNTTCTNIQIDELRIATTTPSVAKRTAEYTNLTDVAHFYATSSIQLQNDGVSTFTLDETATDIDGDILITGTRVVAPSSLLTVGGSFTVTDGLFDANNATTTFDSVAGTETITMLGNSFYNATFDAAGGDWTMLDDIEVTNNLWLLQGSQFTQATGTRITVGGIFKNAIGSVTNWTDSTLVLTGGDYIVTNRLDAGDTYATIEVSNNSDIVIWNSSISTSSIQSGSSIYMPDFSGTDGLLRIYGDYDRSSGDEYWNYATDFDGTDLSGGNERTVTVEIENASQLDFGASSTLHIVGAPGATTTVYELFGLYEVTLDGATLDMQYAHIKGMGVDGLHLTNNSSITKLTDTLFEVSNGRSGITVDASTINTQPSSEFSHVYFATTTATTFYDNAWSDQLIVTVQASAIDAPVSDFPVYVDLSTLGPAFWSGVKSDGSDIRVTTSGADELPIDLVWIDTASSSGELYFLAPQLDSVKDTVFYIHYNNPNAVAYAPSDTYGSQAVWKNYEAVYHFNNGPSLTPDETSHGRDLSNTVGTAATTSGLLGEAIDMTPSNVMLYNPGWRWKAGDDLISSGLYFMSAVDNGALWQFGNGGGSNNGTYLAFMPNYDSTWRGRHFFGITSGGDYIVTGYDNTKWHHFTTIGRAADGAQNEIYEDGQLWDSVTQITSSANPSNVGLKIGRYQTYAYSDIQIDELRFATTTPSNAARNAEYTNFTDSTSFYATSTEVNGYTNVTADGIPSTFWLFSNGSGDLYGEAFDNDDGNPGSIQWDDSDYGITISGTVYADDGVTHQTAPVCNGSTEVVTVVIDDTSTYTAACDPSDGSYEVSGIIYNGTPKITTYINSNATSTQTNVAVSDEVTGSGTVSGNTITITRPNVIDNSVLVAIIGKNDDPAITAPAGWTELASLGNTSGDDIRTGIWYKVVSNASSEPSTYNFTTPNNNSRYSYWTGSLINVDTNNPVDVSTAWTKYQNTYNPVAATTTTVTNGALALAAWYVFSDSDVTPPFGSWKVRAEDIVSVSDGSLTIASKVFETATTTDAVRVYNVAEARESQAGQFVFRPAANPTATGTISATVVTKTPLGAAATPHKKIIERDQRSGFVNVPSGGSLAVPAPVMHDGDVLVAILGKEDNYTITAPSGWTLADEYSATVGSRSYAGLWYKVVGNAAAEPDTYDFINNDTSAEETNYWIGSFENVDTTHVFDVTPSWSNVQNTSSPTAPSITTVSGGALVLAAWVVMYDNTMTMPGAPWTTLAEDLNISSRAMSVVSRTFDTAGPTGDVSITDGSVDDVDVGQFALRPAPISVADGISDMDLYANRVIVRHEDATALSIADMTMFDNSNDSDIAYTAATGTPTTLDVLAGSGLMVWKGKTFTPGGDVVMHGVGSTSADGSFLLGENAVYTNAGADALTVGGSFYAQTGAVYNGASSTVTFTATSSGQQIGSDASSTITFYKMDFTGNGGGWAVNTPIVSQTGITVDAGTISGISDITVENGSFSGNGIVNLTDGSTYIKHTNTLGGNNPWTFYNLTLGDGVSSDVTTPASVATTTIRGTLTITNNHLLDANNSHWDFSGSGTVFVENGSFLEDTSLVQYSGSSENILRTNYYDLHVDAATGTVSVIAPSVSLSVLHDFVLGQHATATLDISVNNPSFAVGGDITIGDKGTLIASNSSTLEAFGSWSNTGSFTANGGLVAFKNASGTATIAAGSSSFANMSIVGDGSFVITQHATATEDMLIGDTSTFTLNSGQQLAVGGTFTNAGTATTWTGSTLYLYGGQAYTINAKDESDSYATVHIAGNTQPRMWNSSIGTLTVDAGSSLYSMDHNDIAGDLYIFGDYKNNSYNDYWDYARDWDGVTLTGSSSRNANVYIEGGASVSYTGGSLSVTGASTASTTVQNQGSGTYGLTVGGSASSTWDYAVPRDLSIDGIVFTGSATVESFDHLDLLTEIDNGQVVTVGGTVIDANPAKNFDLDIFNVAAGVTGAKNVTATGTSVSSWRFTNHTGNLDGEAFDNDSGDPGEIVWIDSAALITISGKVYADEGTTVSSVCDGTTNNITIVVAGLTTYNTTCDAATGAYSVSNIGFGPTDAIVVYINGETQKAATVTADPISNIGNMDLYEHRVIVRHESTDPIRIADLAVWDSSDDSDIPYTAVDAATDTLTLPANTKLIVWTSKEFAPAGNVTTSGGGAGAAYDGTVELYDNAKWTSAGTQEHSIGGSLISGPGATFTAGNATTTFTTSASGRTIDINNGSFYNLAFTGTGSWSVTDNTLEAHNVLLSAGTLTLPTGTTTIHAGFHTTGASFVHNGSLMIFDGPDTNMTVAFGGSDVAQLRFTGSGSWNMTDANATSTDSITIQNGTVTLPSGSLSLVGNFRNEGGSLVHNNVNLIFNNTGSSTLLASSSDLGSVTENGTGTLTFEDGDVTLAGSLTIHAGAVTVASGTTAIGGSLDASGGTFNHASGSILFNSSDSGETVTMGANDLYNVVFGSASGGWTIIGNATTSNNFTLSAANNFTLQNGSTLHIGGVFTNSVGGAATTWTGSTIVLYSATTYEINTKTSGGDSYETLTVASGTDISMWNSDASTVNVNASSSLYSQDHAGNDGDLSIFGAYKIATSSEYWSYATDFDGTDISGSPRTVTVRFATTSTSSLTMTGGLLDILGTASATTTIQSAGAGNYALHISGGTLNASHYAFADLDATGLHISGNPSIVSLSDGSFTQSQNNAKLITLTTSALDTNASLLISNAHFDNAGYSGGVNVSLDATSTNSWKFTAHTGNLSGEAFDEDGSDDCSSIRWDDSACLLTEQTHYRWRNDDGGEGAIDSTWFDNNWTKRKRVRIVNADTSSYTNTAVKMNVSYDADMQTDFDDIRFTDASGTSTIPYWIEKSTIGVSAEVWVQVPSLPANQTTEIYMYYGHVTATTTSSSSATFSVVDDFDDGNISEYSGDTTLFEAGSGFAYGGGYGLDTAGHEGDRATDGIFRFDQTINQGDTIRYHQYIDTTAGSSDEACTLFGVQSPGTTNQNYGVCLELFGVDRMSLVKNAESTDTYGAVTVLASSTVSYTTGWYTVEVDWNTDNSIDVTLFDPSDAVVATTTATDSSYTSGGYGVTYWGFNGGWDSVTAQAQTQSTPQAYFGAEQTSGGATWAAAQDTPVGGFAFGDTIRLRTTIENSGLAISNQQFQLEFAPKLTAPSCESVSGASYVTVPPVTTCGTSAVCMTASTTITNGQSTTDHLLVGAIEYTPGAVVIDPDNKTGSMNLSQDHYTELEYAIQLTANANNDAYCFRVTNNGSALDSYAKVAELTLAFDPVMSAVSFNDGLDITLSPGATTTIVATTTVTDLNGYADLSLASSTFYTTSAGASCSADNNNCYLGNITNGKCSFSSCSGNSCILTCTADMYYHADPTDTNGEDWYAFLEVEDASGGYAFNTSAGIDVLTLRALGVENVIDYGTVDLNSDTGSYNATTTLINQGNEAIDIEVAGTDMTDGGVSVIGVQNQKYATSSFTYSSCTFCSILDVVNAAVNVDLGKPTTDSPPVEDELYWGIYVPTGTNSAPHTGHNTFYVTGAL